MLWTLAGCGGGGGGGPTDPGGGGPPVQFTATGGGASNSIVLRSGTGTTGSTLELEVVVAEVTGLFGVAFDLDYPATLLRYENAAEGPFLREGGVSTSFQAVSAQPGTVVVGLTRLGSGSGRDGSGVLLTLRFSAIGNGSGSIVLDDRRAIDARGIDLPGLSWGSGTIRTNL